MAEAVARANFHREQPACRIQVTRTLINVQSALLFKKYVFAVETCTNTEGINMLLLPGAGDVAIACHKVPGNNLIFR